MFDLRTALQAWSRREQREITYFLIRYFKQLHFLESGGKDVFDDVFARSPSLGVRHATLDFANSIETSIGQKAADFDQHQSEQILRFLIGVHEELKDDLSQQDYDKAAAFFSRLR
ncbi:hypothetical protein HFN51_27800 [Rhizobium leguminosarum]|nr:hypothetical protein [Rhizobium leguminosarum]